MIAPALIRCTEAVGRATKRAQLVPLEKRLTLKMRAAFRAQGRAVLANFRPLSKLFDKPVSLREAAEPSDWGPAFDDAVLATLGLFEEPLTDMTTAALGLGIRTQLAQLDAGIDFGLRDPAAVAYLDGRAALRVTGINETTRAGIGRILSQAADEGWSYSRAAQAIKTRYDGFADGTPGKASRAKVVAVTELGDAYTQGQLLTGQKLAAAGIPMQKMQSVVSQGNVCPLCIANNQQGWIPLAQPFSSGHMAPLIHPSCRCSLLQRMVPAA